MCDLVFPHRTGPVADPEGRAAVAPPLVQDKKQTKKRPYSGRNIEYIAFVLSIEHLYCALSQLILRRIER